MSLKFAGPRRAPHEHRGRVRGGYGRASDTKLTKIDLSISAPDALQKIGVLASVSIERGASVLRGLNPRECRPEWSSDNPKAPGYTYRLVLHCPFTWFRNQRPSNPASASSLCTLESPASTPPFGHPLSRPTTFPPRSIRKSVGMAFTPNLDATFSLPNASIKMG